VQLLTPIVLGCWPPLSCKGLLLFTLTQLFQIRAENDYELRRQVQRTSGGCPFVLCRQQDRVLVSRIMTTVEACGI